MNKVDLTKGKVLSVIAALALPIMGSSLMQFTYNLIDMMWVGHLGSNAVASIGSSSLYINIGNAINALVVIGTGIKVAHAVGRKDNHEVKEYINAGIIINIIIGAIFGLILILLGRHFIGFLNLQNEEVERNAYYYLALNAPILFFAFFNMMYTSTLIANIIMFICFRMSTKGIFNYDFETGLDKSKMKEIVRLGFPMAFQRVLFTVINIFIAKIIAIFGSDAIAAQKVGVQIESIAYMIIGGLNGAVASFTGQNFGAKKFKRIKDGYKSALIVGTSYALIMAAAFLLLNKPMIRLFISDGAASEIAASYLKVVAFSQVFSAVEMISNGMFTGIGKQKIPASISIIFTSLRIPLALVLIKPFGINGIWMSICISSILKGICAYMIYELKVRRKFTEDEAVADM